MRTLLYAGGSVAIALGAFWIVQRGGWSPWPLSQLSLPNTRWVTYGAIPVLGGWALLVFARRL